MYRTNAQSRVIEEAFVRFGLPYKLVAGTRFYERREVKDVIAYLRLVQNPYDSVSLLRVINVPNRGIGQQTLNLLSKWAQEQGISLFDALQRLITPENVSVPMPFNTRTAKILGGFGSLLKDLISRSRETNLLDFFDHLTVASGYKDFILTDEDGDERWDNVQELRTVAETYRELAPPDSLTSFLESVALVSDVDDLEESINKVTLITLHQAKGLEFGNVFMVGVEEGLLPHIRSLDDPFQMEEERRLCYVGITRARRRIYLTHAFRRTLMGRSTVNKASRFLQDIPKNLIAGSEVWHTAESKLGSDYRTMSAIISENKPEPPSLQLKAGDRVRHSIFGEGVVVSCTPKPGDAEVVAAFGGVGVKKLLLSFAKLEKVP